MSKIQEAVTCIYIGINIFCCLYILCDQMYGVHLLNIARYIQKKKWTYNLRVLKCLLSDQASPVIKGGLVF